MGKGSALVVASLMFATAACGGPARAVDRLPALGAPALHRPVSVGSNQVQLLTDGASAMARLRTASSRATATIEAEIYEFERADLAGDLEAALRRGVKVTLIEDPTVSVNAATAARLRQAGAEVRIFPVQPRQIDHVKLLIVDGAVAIFGGMNWGTWSWLNHDFDVAVEGPVVKHLEAIFAADLIRSGGRTQIAKPPPDDGTLRLLTTYPEPQVLPVVLNAIAKAADSIFVEMFVMTDTEAIAALCDAARRGVRVFVLFDPNQDLNQLAAPRLMQAGVQTRFYRTSGEKLHAKVMEVDGRRLLVGSANWTSSGFVHNHELDTFIDSASLASQALERMEADWAAS